MNRVPEADYVNVGGVKIVTWDQLKAAHTQEDYKRLIHWMDGQTCIQDGLYTWDYERWLAGLPVID